eukprot:jgi/Mesvir1/16598/Mv10133-RA.1
MGGGWYDDMLAESSAEETTKMLTEPLALKPSSIKKLDEHGMKLAKKYSEYVKGTYVTDAAKTVAWYVLFLIGTIRLAVRRFRSMTRVPDDEQEYEVYEAVVCGDESWAYVTEEFCELQEKGAGTVCVEGGDLLELMEPEALKEVEGEQVSLAVTYAHHGREHIVTYSLADPEPVRFPPVKPVAESVDATPATKFTILSASFGTWFSSEDNADVTDTLVRLLGPDRDFYAAAGIRHDTDLDVDAPAAPIVYKGRALLNLLATADKKWPLSTDVACWWCCHTFTNTPCPLPVAYKEGKGFLVKGCFCSFNCAKAYNSREGGASKDLHNHYLFLMTQRLWYASHKGVPFPGVICAPSRACLKMFGGYMSIQEFRAAACTHVHMLREPPYPMEVIQQVDCATAISDQRYAMMQSATVKNSAMTNEKASKKASELESRKRTRQEGALSLKRAKPMVSKGCSLDKFVNVKAQANKK